MKHSLTVDDVRSIYRNECDKHARDQRVHGNLTLKEAMVRATRTAVYARLHEELPTPLAESIDDPDDVHAMQKSHGKALWKEVDRLVTEAKL